MFAADSFTHGCSTPARSSIFCAHLCTLCINTHAHIIRSPKETKKVEAVVVFSRPQKAPQKPQKGCFQGAKSFAQTVRSGVQIPAAKTASHPVGCPKSFGLAYLLCYIFRPVQSKHDTFGTAKVARALCFLICFHSDAVCSCCTERVRTFQHAPCFVVTFQP